MTTPDRATGAAAALGLPADATREQVEATQQQLEAFLSTAPESLKPWADRQRTLAQQAVAGTPSAADAAVAEELELLGLDPETTPVGQTPAATPVPVRINPPKKRGFLWPLALIAASAAIVVGVYSMGDKPQQAQPTAENSAMQQVPGSTPKPADPKLVASLEAKVKADPKDVISMKALGQVYDRAGDYTKAAAWQERVTTVDPKDVDAWLALGVAQFNGAHLDKAEISWKKAATLAPKRAEIYYNLGFLYMSQNKMDKAKEAWATVVELDPKSDLAKTVESHVKRSTASASGKATTPAASAPAGSPSASATPSR